MSRARRQECMIGVFWTGLNDVGDDGRGHNHFRGMTTANLGLNVVPMPAFTSREIQDILYAAKMQALRCLYERGMVVAMKTKVKKGRE